MDKSSLFRGTYTEEASQIICKSSKREKRDAGSDHEMGTSHNRTKSKSTGRKFVFQKREGNLVNADGLELIAGEQPHPSPLDRWDALPKAFVMKG